MPQGWSVQFERGRIQYVCGSCSRENLRSIEGKLGGDFWEH